MCVLHSHILAYIHLHIIGDRHLCCNTFAALSCSVLCTDQVFIGNMCPCTGTKATVSALLHHFGLPHAGIRLGLFLGPGTWCTGMSSCVPLPTTPTNATLTFAVPGRCIPPMSCRQCHAVPRCVQCLRCLCYEAGDRDNHCHVDFTTAADADRCVLELHGLQAFFRIVLCYVPVACHRPHCHS